MPNELEEIQKRHIDNTQYIAKREKQGRWWWTPMHKQTHRDRAWLLDHVQNLEQQL